MAAAARHQADRDPPANPPAAVENGPAEASSLLALMGAAAGYG